jgi:hypothetical protein
VSGPGFAEGFVGEGVQFSAGGIAGDVAVKQPGTQFGDFLVAEAVNGLLDFLHGAHAGNIAGEEGQARASFDHGFHGWTWIPEPAHAACRP